MLTKFGFSEKKDTGSSSAPYATLNLFPFRRETPVQYSHFHYCLFIFLHQTPNYRRCTYRSRHSTEYQLCSCCNARCTMIISSALSCPASVPNPSASRAALSRMKVVMCAWTSCYQYGRHSERHPSEKTHPKVDQ